MAALLAVEAFAPLHYLAAEPPPLEAYGRLPDTEDMALSPSGTRIAAAMSVNGERMVILMDDQLNVLRMMRLDQAKLRSLEWAGDDHLIAEISRTEVLGPEFVNRQVEFWHVLILPVSAEARQGVVFDKDPGLLNAVFGAYGLRNIDGRWVAFYGAIERQRGARGFFIGNSRPALYAVDVARNTHRQAAPPGSQGESTTWLIDAEGRIAATFSIDYARGSWRIKAPDGPELASGIAPRGDAGLVALGRDGASLIFSELDEGEQRTIWYEVALDGRGTRTRLAAQEEIEAIFLDHASGHLIGLERTGAGSRAEFFDPAHQAAVNRIYQAFPGLQVRLVDWTADFSKMLVRTIGNGDSGTWFLVDLRQMRADALGYERKAIGPEHVGAVSRVEYTAQDGLELDGILTLPPGREPRNLPVILLPHGGPHSHDEEGFDWWAQAFASRGYVVFQPNFRGSTNRDEAFMRAGFGQWGKAMQTDISDGLAELARRGIADPKRACIMGASYGGYAALAGVTLQQGLYRCAVAVAPVSDLSTLFTDEYRPGSNAGMIRRSLIEELGPRSGFDAVSPFRQASRANAPVLLIHGRDDTVVPFDQSKMMADALKDAHKPHRLVELSGEDHWLSRGETRLQMLKEAMAFILEHNPPD